MSMRPPDRPAPLRFFALFFAAGVFCIGLSMLMCSDREASGPTPRPVKVDAAPEPAAASTEIPLPATDQHLCTAVVVLVDNSGSMQEKVRDSAGTTQRKHVIARDALQRIVRYTGEWKKTHADRALQLGLYNFSSSAAPVLPMAEFKLPEAEAAARRIPPPGGGTAIGEALTAGFKALYQSGCTRKYLVCITDGENTVGPRPDRVARQLYSQTKGDVEIHFVAFDTSASKFGFLGEVNGHVVEAADGEQLQARLSEIYEKRILAETMPAEQ